MNDPTSYIARLGLARDQLAEARRYVLTQPQAARKLLADAIFVFAGLTEVAGGPFQLAVYRCWANANAVRSAVGVDNDAACGGIDLVRHELAILMSDLRREWGREDRDRELTEAYGS